MKKFIRLCLFITTITTITVLLSGCTGIINFFKKDDVTVDSDMQYQTKSFDQIVEDLAHYNITSSALTKTAIHPVVYTPVKCSIDIFFANDLSDGRCAALRKVIMMINEALEYINPAMKIVDCVNSSSQIVYDYDYIIKTGGEEVTETAYTYETIEIDGVRYRTSGTVEFEYIDNLISQEELNAKCFKIILSILGVPEIPRTVATDVFTSIMDNGNDTLSECKLYYQDAIALIAAYGDTTSGYSSCNALLSNYSMVFPAVIIEEE